MTAIPGNKAVLRVPIEQLQRLPAGAEYSFKRGASRVRLLMDADSVCAVSETDSVFIVVPVFTETTKGKKREKSELEHLNKLLTTALVAGVVTILFIGVLIKSIKK